MPKATLEFELPEEYEEFTNACKVYDWINAIHTFDQWLRKKLKYEELSDEEDAIYQKVREELWNQLSEWGVSV